MKRTNNHVNVAGSIQTGLLRLLWGVFVWATTCLTAFSQTYVGGEILEDEVFSAENNPYIVIQDLVVNEDVTLTILPGVELQFEQGIGLINNGILVAKGTSDQKISFNARSLSPAINQWEGIVLNHSLTLTDQDTGYLAGSIISDAVFSGATACITMDNNSKLLIQNCNFANCTYGIYFNKTTQCIIRKCSFQAVKFGAFIAQGQSNAGNCFEGNQFNSCSDVGLFINNQAALSHHNVVENNIFASCVVGLHCGNINNTGEGFNIISNNTFIDNKDAVRLYHSNNEITFNYFAGNRSGLILRQSNHNTISNNVMRLHKLNAIEMREGSSENKTLLNDICFNYGGIVLYDATQGKLKDNTFIYNTLAENSGYNFDFYNTPQGATQFNNILTRSEVPMFINLSDSVLHAEYNFWGTCEEERIKTYIFDKNDDASKGRVIYQPFFPEIISIAPVPPPVKVIKQIVGSNILVSWEGPNVKDIAGYHLYTQPRQTYHYNHVINCGLSTYALLPGLDINDTIAVTAYDLQAGSNKDQLLGFESDYSIAQKMPYAGPDTTVCSNDGYYITIASIPGYGSVQWSTTGDGLFSDAISLTTTYFPGPVDVVTGSVKLILQQMDGDLMYLDTAFIRFINEPLVFAGSDTAILQDSTLALIRAYAGNYESVNWTTNGDGYFEPANQVNPNYIPGVEDIAGGTVTITLTAFSKCGEAASSFQLKILKAFSIYGKVHAGNTTKSGATLMAIRDNDEKSLQRETFSLHDGNFALQALTPGEYYLYAIPPPEDKGLMPAYFFNCIHWEQAERINVASDVFDVDVILPEFNEISVTGTGTVTGSILNPDNSTTCGNVTILLFDPEMKHVLRYQCLSELENAFKFRDLPFGKYRLAGEKARTKFSVSDVFELTPQQPLLSEIIVTCESSTPGFILKQLPDNNNGTGESEILMYPNPVLDILLVETIESDMRFADAIVYSNSGAKCDGVQIQYYENRLLLNVATLASGCYFLKLVSKTGDIMIESFIKY
jgi:nitrous oxidase accessory protein NosD